MTMIDIAAQLARIAPVPTRPTEQIDGIALHHTAGPGDPWAWAKYHTTPPSQGGPFWGPGNTIGYHAVIMRDGKAYKTAYDSDRVPGVANHNWHLVHVCFAGDLSREGLTPEQLVAGYQVVRQYQVAYAIPPARVKGHGEWVDDPTWNTSCPGVHLGETFRAVLELVGRGTLKDG